MDNKIFKHYMNLVDDEIKEVIDSRSSWYYPNQKPEELIQSFIVNNLNAEGCERRNDEDNRKLLIKFAKEVSHRWTKDELLLEPVATIERRKNIRFENKTHKDDWLEFGDGLISLAESMVNRQHVRDAICGVLWEIEKYIEEEFVGQKYLVFYKKRIIFADGTKLYESNPQKAFIIDFLMTQMTLERAIIRKEIEETC